VAIGKPEEVSADTVVHRVGGGNAANLQLSAMDCRQSPPGISILVGRTPQEAAAQMRRAFPKSKKWQASAQTVGSATVGAVRLAGFEVVPDPTSRFPNHARLIHAAGIAGFTDAQLEILAKSFHDRPGC
jgi:hypothetical protein